MPNVNTMQRITILNYTDLPDYGILVLVGQTLMLGETKEPSYMVIEDYNLEIKVARNLKDSVQFTVREVDGDAE